MTSRGLTADSAGQPAPNRSRTPGRKFSTSTSQAVARSSSGPTSPGRCKSIRALARVELQVQPGTAADDLAVRLRDVRAWQFGLDHIGAEVGQDPAGERAGHRPRQVEHAQPVEGPTGLTVTLRHAAQVTADRHHPGTSP